MALRAIHTHPIANSESIDEISIGSNACKKMSYCIEKKDILR